MSPAFYCIYGAITKWKGENKAGEIKSHVVEKKEKDGRKLLSHIKTEAERVDGGLEPHSKLVEGRS